MTDPQWLIFVRMGVRYAVRDEVLIGVLPRPVATRVPGAPSHVLGLVAWRGGVLPLLEPGTDLAGRDPHDVRLRATIIARAGGSLVALAADTVENWETVTGNALLVDPLEALARCRTRISAVPPEPRHG